MYNNNIQRKMPMKNKRNGEGENSTQSEGEYSTLTERHKAVIDNYMETAIEDNVFVSVIFLMRLLHSFGPRVCI